MRCLFRKLPWELPASYRNTALSLPLNCSTACRRLMEGCSSGICIPHMAVYRMSGLAAAGQALQEHLKDPVHKHCSS